MKSSKNTNSIGANKRGNANKSSHYESSGRNSHYESSGRNSHYESMADTVQPTTPHTSIAQKYGHITVVTASFKLLLDFLVRQFNFLRKQDTKQFGPVVQWACDNIEKVSQSRQKFISLIADICECPNSRANEVLQCSLQTSNEGSFVYSKWYYGKFFVKQETLDTHTRVLLDANCNDLLDQICFRLKNVLIQMQNQRNESDPHYTEVLEKHYNNFLKLKNYSAKCLEFLSKTQNYADINNDDDDNGEDFSSARAQVIGNDNEEEVEPVRKITIAATRKVDGSKWATIVNPSATGVETKVETKVESEPEPVADPNDSNDFSILEPIKVESAPMRQTRAQKKKAQQARTKQLVEEVDKTQDQTKKLNFVGVVVKPQADKHQVGESNPQAKKQSSVPIGPLHEHEHEHEHDNETAIPAPALSDLVQVKMPFFVAGQMTFSVVVMTREQLAAIPVVDLGGNNQLVK